MEKYPNKFQISADYLNLFNKPLFENTFKPGSRIKLSIPRHQQHLLGTENRILITSLNVGGTQYFSKKESIEIETSFISSYIGFILGGFSCIIGVLIFLFYDRFQKTSKISPGNG